ncbi:MAG: aminotransferase class IV [Actinomycetes bacterium]
MTSVVWADGQLRPPTEPVYTALDHGVTVGDGVYETIAMRNGQPFALTRHLLRLQYSAERLGIRDIDVHWIREGISQVIAARPQDIVRLRVTVTSGPGPMGYLRDGGPSSVVIIGGPSVRPRQCVAVRAPWKRNERSPLAGVKTTSTAENVVMAQFAREKGADEAIVSNTHGHLCEGTSTNIFIERNGEVLTPPLASGCLPGITRGLVLEWGARAGLPVRVAAPGELPMSVLDEVVRGEAHASVTSTTRGVQPIARLDGADVKPGPVLTRLATLFDQYASADPDPAPPRGAVTRRDPVP